MNGRNAHLAVLLRKCEWLLDDTAHAAYSGRLSSADRVALAEALDELAQTLRGYRAGWTETEQ